MRSAFKLDNTIFRLNVLLSGAPRSFPLHKAAQTASSRPAACLEPTLWRGVAPLCLCSLPQQLGAIILLLCVSVMGKRVQITTGEELADNYIQYTGVGEELRLLVAALYKPPQRSEEALIRWEAGASHSSYTV